MRVLRQFAPRGECTDLQQLKALFLSLVGDRGQRLPDEFWVRLGGALGAARCPEELVQRWTVRFGRGRQVDGVDVSAIIAQLGSREALSLLLVDSSRLSYDCAAKLSSTSPRQFARCVHRARWKARSALVHWGEPDPE